MIESILLAAARVLTFAGGQALTNASGFYFERDNRLFLVTSGHVLSDGPSKHFPDRVEIELHTDPEDLGKSTGYSMLLYRNGKSVWRQGRDSSGGVDVAVIEIDRASLPRTALYRAFTPGQLLASSGHVAIGQSLLVIGFPLGFHDTLHHLPVARQAVLASSYGLRFQGKGYFLTDARTHRGSSGAPVVMRSAGSAASEDDLSSWVLLGVHSARLDVGNRDIDLDEGLGLNCAWYADILIALTASG